MKTKLETGDLVKHITGGPVMVVTGVTEFSTTTQYWNGTEFKYGAFDSDFLVKQITSVDHYGEILELLESWQRMIGLGGKVQADILLAFCEENNLMRSVMYGNKIKNLTNILKSISGRISSDTGRKYTISWALSKDNNYCDFMLT